MQEIWKDINSYEGLYQVSNRGNVKSCEKKRNGSNAILKPKNLKLSTDKDGYKKIILSKEKNKYNHYVHRLVANAFLENIENKPQVNHIDGVKNNNYFINLEWVTLSENRIHAYKTGLQKGTTGEYRKHSKLTPQNIIDIRELRGKLTQFKIAEMFGISFQHVSDIQLNKKWKHI